VKRLMRVPWLLKTVPGQVGAVLLLFVLGVAFLGPLFAPHDLAAPIGVPGAKPSGAFPLGTDYLGRDVLSRVLDGGLSVVWIASAATLLSYAAGLTIGLVAGHRRSLVDPVLMRGVDVLLALPGLLILLLLIAALGPHVSVLIAGVAVVQLPPIARIVRTATLEVSTRGYVEAAHARGERTNQILRREILPNIAPVLLADVGIRFGYSIILIASVNYLGLGLAPPAADWGLMIAENQQYIVLNVWGVLAPAIMLALLTVCVNLLADAYVQTLGRSPRSRPLRRLTRRRSITQLEPAVADDGAALVHVRGLAVHTATHEPIVEDVTFSVAAGEALGIVGETGSGKTTTVLAMLGYTKPGSAITAGEVRVGSLTMTATHGHSHRELRGKVVSYVPQNPAGSLNPSMRVSDAILEMLQAHQSGRTSATSVAAALAQVGLPAQPEFQRRFPHQLSGGQQQRVCIAVALVCEPPVIVLDEPATGLDVVTQARLLEELTRLRSEVGVSMVYVTHDLAVVAGFADRIAVMYAGRIVELGPTAELLERPKHPYTRGLLNSIPDHVRPRGLEPIPGIALGVGGRPAGCAFADRCSLRVDACEEAVPPLREDGERHLARCLRSELVSGPSWSAPTMQRSRAIAAESLLTVRELRAEHRGRGESVVAAEDISFAVGRGECVALVGESGSGKTTIARTIAGLHPASSGEILLGDQPLAREARARSLAQRQRIQIVFQDPSDALNPRHTIRTAVSRPACVLRGLSRREAEAEANRLLALVRLPQRLGGAYPAELSGGERQRVGIARALAAQPGLMICDEITSSLDVSVQAAVLNLISELRESLGLSLLLITHDLGVVSTIADRVLVLERGLIVEKGETASVLTAPSHRYTRSLLEAAPSLSKVVAH
jgi:peptide/nickel transport system ATP-binding protein